MTSRKLTIEQAQMALKDADESVIDSAIELIDPIDWAEEESFETGVFHFVDSVELTRRFLNLRERVHYRDLLLASIADRKASGR